MVEWKNVDASLALTSVHGDRFGPVTKMIGLASSLNKVDGPNWPSLEQLMRIGLIKRGNPVYDSSGDLTGPSGYLTGPSGNPIDSSGDLTGPFGDLLVHLAILLILLATLLVHLVTLLVHRAT